MESKYDFIVIGSGPAGHTAAIKAAQEGLKVAVIEKDPMMLGGVCLNEGCIPAKSLLNDAHIYSRLKKNHGLYGSEVGAINLAGVVAKSRKSAEQLRGGLGFLFKKNKIDLIEGTAKFTGSDSIEVEGSTIKADNFLIATGSAPKELSNVSFDGEFVLNSSDAMRLEDIPESILIVGAGAIGCEFASFFSQIGSKVTLIEAEKSILPFEDKEVSRRLQSYLKQKGALVRTGVLLESVDAGSKTANIKSGDKIVTESFAQVLVAVGRTPSTASLALENAKVKLTDKGFIEVNEKLETSAGNIFAAGDVISTPMLAHSASAEGEVVVECITGAKTDAIDYDSMPNVVYTDVGVASVGITEEVAKEQGLDYSTGKQFFKANGRAVVNDMTDGFIKVIADSKTHKILGVHILNHDAPEIIHEFVVAKRAGLKVDDIAGAIHAHPTLSETALEACKSVFGKPING